jgi:hypothetical protein
MEADSKGEANLIGLVGPHPSSEIDGRYRDARIRITFDKSQGMSVKDFTTWLRLDGKEWKSEFEVSSYAEFPGGIFVPSRIEYRWSNGDSPIPLLTQWTELSEIRVNEDVPDSLLTFSFPENVLVVDQDLNKSDRSDRYVMYIAERGGQLKRINDVSELAVLQERFGTQKQSVFQFLPHCAIALLFISLVLYWRMRLRRSRV